MDPTFWSTMAEVSATFVGLVFVGLSLYLGSSRAAVNEMEAEPGMEEQSSRIMFVSVLSNLAFFVLPLVASLALINRVTPSDHSLFGLSTTVYLLLLGTLLWGYESPQSRQQVKLVLSENARGKVLRLRLEYIKWLLYLIVLIYVLLLSATFGWLPFSNAEDWLKGLAFFSTVFGLGCGVGDLIVFDVDNILFRVPERVEERLEHTQQELRAVMKEIEGLYRKYEVLVQSPEYQELLRQMMHNPGVIAVLNPTRIRGQIQAEQIAIRSTYNRLREEIPAEGEVEVIQQFRTKGKVVTYADMRILKRQLELLSQEADAFKKLLEDKLAFFKGRGIYAEEARAVGENLPGFNNSDV